MNRKQFMTLMALLLVIVAISVVVFWNTLVNWGTAPTTGTRPFEKLVLNDVARIELTDSKGSVTLVRRDQAWVVTQSADAPASVASISALLRKLPDLKIVQSQQVGESLLPRLQLATGKGAAAATDGVGTRLLLSDSKDAPLAQVLLGKIMTEDSPLPIKPQTAVARYALLPGNTRVVLLSDPLSEVSTDAARWLAPPAPPAPPTPPVPAKP